MDPRMDDHRSVDDQPATTCYRHPERVTGLRCSRCGRPICGECAVPAAVGQLCPDDARDRPRVRRLADRGRPVVTLSLLAINTVLLLVEVALSGNGIGGLIEPSNRALCRLGALNAPAVIQDGQYWRLLTVMVLHAGIIHWAFNSYALFIFGPTLEALLGRVRFLALYVGSGFAASAASLLFSHTQLGVGASAGWPVAAASVAPGAGPTRCSSRAWPWRCRSWSASPWSWPPSAASPPAPAAPEPEPGRIRRSPSCVPA